jgi:hypothetical protein
LKHDWIADPEDLDLDCARSFDCAGITILNKELASKNAIPKEAQIPGDPRALANKASTTKGPIDSEERIGISLPCLLSINQRQYKSSWQER